MCAFKLFLEFYHKMIAIAFIANKVQTSRALSRQWWVHFGPMAYKRKGECVISQSPEAYYVKVMRRRINPHYSGSRVSKWVILNSLQVASIHGKVAAHASQSGSVCTMRFLHFSVKNLLCFMKNITIHYFRKVWVWSHFPTVHQQNRVWEDVTFLTKTIGPFGQGLGREEVTSYESDWSKRSSSFVCHRYPTTSHQWEEPPCHT